MSATWPILLGMFAVIVAAAWYDATIASAGGPALDPPAATARAR